MPCLRSQREDLTPYRGEDAAQDAAPSVPLGPAAGGHEQSSKIAALLRGLAACVPSRPAAPVVTRTLTQLRARRLPADAKSLVFSQWTALLDIAAPFLAAAGYGVARLDGSMSLEERGAAVARFTHEPRCRVFLLSLQAGGVGLHLVAATHVWMLDPWWNPAVEMQAQERCHRLGQSRPVTVHRLYIRDTVEQAIVALQERKRGLAASTLAGDLKALNRLNLADLKLLFTRPASKAAPAAGK